MLARKKVYRVFRNYELWKKDIDFLNEIRCTDNFNCRNMTIQDAWENSECISGHIIDESIKDCLIFTFLDAINYGLEEDKFVEISYEGLLKCCEEIETIYYVDNEKIKE